MYINNGEKDHNLINTYKYTNFVMEEFCRKTHHETENDLI